MVNSCDNIKSLTLEESLVMAMLIGEYAHQLDAKNRMRIPAKLKKELGDEYYFAKGTNHCIYVFSREAVDEYFEQLKQKKLTDPEAQRGLRVFSKSFVPAVEDSQGRVILPNELREHALLGKDDKDLIICGAVTRVEIWSKKSYADYYGNEEENYDDVFGGLDI